MPAAAMASVAKVLRLSPETFEEAVEAATRVLLRGGVVALPTDTLYGVSTLIEYSDKLYSLKRRPREKPLGLFVSSAADVSHWAKMTINQQLANQLLPGPVTLIFERKSSLPDVFNPGTNNVGVRVPDSQLVRSLCARLDRPLAQTSANVSGSPLNPVCLSDFEDILPEIDLVLDGGLIGDGSGDSAQGSTIIDLTIDGKYSIVRDGCAKKSSEEVLRANGLSPLTYSL